jgi:hypothetical protein
MPCAAEDLLRTIQADVGEWNPDLMAHHHLWNTAVDALVFCALGAVERSNRWLKEILTAVAGPPFLQHMNDLEDSAGLSAVVLALRLLKPSAPLILNSGQAMHIECVTEGAIISTPDGELSPLVAGARYVFGVDDGSVEATHRLRRQDVHKGQRFGILAQDFHRVIVRFSTGPNAANLFRLAGIDEAKVAANNGPVKLATWECECGTWDCPARHRLGSWHPKDLPLEQFVNSAINGRNWPITSKSFRDSMYYAYLSSKGWG